MSGTVCRHCGSLTSLVVETREANYRGMPVRRRRRKCHDCGKNTSTIEMTVPQLGKIEEMKHRSAE